MVTKINPEDTIILIDTSRSMARKDFIPDRMSIVLNTITNFIKKKFLIDPKDRISLLIVGNTPKLICGLTFEQEELLHSFNKITISGKGKLHSGISFAVQLLIREMRKVGGKTSRIFIISDNKSIDFNEKVSKLINTLKGLGIIVDSCQLGKYSGNERTFLKRIAQDTGGEFGYFNNPKAIINSGKAFASKKQIKETNEFYSQKNYDKTPLISEVALSLRRPSLLEIQMMMAEKNITHNKCAICHSIKAPLTGADYFTEGRSCPSCDRAMHLSCAVQWAKKSESKEEVFRCPFCFFLLKIPKSTTTLLDSDKLNNSRIKILPEEKTTVMTQIEGAQVNNIYASCTFCRNIFSEENIVYQCKNCGVYYHEPCLEKLKRQIGGCRYCGSKIL